MLVQCSLFILTGRKNRYKLWTGSCVPCTWYRLIFFIFSFSSSLALPTVLLVVGVWWNEKKIRNNSLPDFWGLFSFVLSQFVVSYILQKVNLELFHYISKWITPPLTIVSGSTQKNVLFTPDSLWIFFVVNYTIYNIHIFVIIKWPIFFLSNWTFGYMYNVYKT